MRSPKKPTAISGNMPVRAGIWIAALACAVSFITTQPAASQEICANSSLSGPTRQLITCGEALVLEREPGTDVTIVERRGSASPKEIILENGAIFIKVLPGSQPTQIRTPHAIAAVRGTTYVVDAGATSTSVLVIEGAVVVSKPDSASSVTLGPGQGVDVEQTSALNVNKWTADRVSSLLARFGR